MDRIQDCTKQSRSFARPVIREARRSPADPIAREAGPECRGVPDLRRGNPGIAIDLSPSAVAFARVLP